jgi:hypothetical protein
METLARPAAPETSRVAPRVPTLQRPGQAVRDGLRRLVATTPDRLRTLRAVVLIGLVGVGIVLVLDVLRADGNIADIHDRIAPIDAGSSTVYRSLAEADASLTGEFILPPGQAADRRAYDAAIAAAAHGLADTESRSQPGTSTSTQLGELAALLPRYTGLAEVARAAEQQDPAAGISSLQQASQLMQSEMLPTAESLQGAQADRLDEVYGSAGGLPVASIAVLAAALAGLTVAQWLLSRWSRRVLNRGAVAATALVLVAAGWWGVAVTVSDAHLSNSEAAERAVTVALEPAQIAADQARAAENLSLITHDSGNEEWNTQMELLARADGAGGALGAARALATDGSDVTNVDIALAAERSYAGAHQAVARDLAAGQPDDAGQIAVGSDPDSSAAKFTALDSALATAAGNEEAASNGEIATAQAWRTGLAVGVGVLLALACLAFGLGVRERLEEYR